jgi:hypothetical protein
MGWALCLLYVAFVLEPTVYVAFVPEPTGYQNPSSGDTTTSTVMKVHTAHDGGRTIVRFDPKMGKKRATPLRAGMPIAFGRTYMRSHKRAIRIGCCSWSYHCAIQPSSPEQGENRRVMPTMLSKAKLKT